MTEIKVRPALYRRAQVRARPEAGGRLMSEDEGLQVQADACPVIRGAYLTGDTEVIRNTEAVHPPSKCIHVKRAAG